jgi:glutaconyl-CoA decarboxylase
MKYVVTLKDKTYEVEVEEGEAMILDEYEVKAPAAPDPAAAPAAAASAAAPAAAAPAALASGITVEAPLPGNVLSIKVNQGDSVAEGDVLLIIEAMKMENEVAAPCAGTVQQISVSVGQMVNTGDTLIVI